MTSHVFRGANGGLAHNMSAPPRSTVSFRPYGSVPASADSDRVQAGGAGLRRILRADPDALLQAHLPDTVLEMRALRREGLEAARDQARPLAAAKVARVRALRLAGLLALASALAGTAPSLQAGALADLAPEALQDRLADLAGRLPPCPGLPALAVAESLAGGSLQGGPGSTHTLAVLWALTHLNGRTFDRDGLPLLAPDLAEGGAWDLFAP